MRKRKISEDRYIIMYNNKYYVVNEYTFRLMFELEVDNNLKNISDKLKISKFKLKKHYEKIKKELAVCEYYEDNFSLDFPLKLQWKITGKCNLKCKHCYLGDLTNTQLSNQELLEICDKIVKSNIMEVTITGGEALLVEALPQITRKLLENDVIVNIYTNAIKLNDFIRKLEKNYDVPKKRIKFMVSIDGMKMAHDLIRGNGTFAKTINNIKHSIFKGYSILTNTVLTNTNYEEVPRLYKLLHSIKVDKIQISNLIVDGRANKEMRLSQDQSKYFLKELKKTLEEIDYGTKLLYANMDSNCSDEIYQIDQDGEKFLQKEEWKCSAGLGKATLDYDGNLYCCPFLKDSVLGNINEKDFEEIWNTKKRMIFLKELAKNNNNSRLCIVAKRDINKNAEGMEKNAVSME